MMNNIKNKRAFTLAETLIVLTVISVIVALMISNARNIIDRNKAVFEKGFSVLQQNAAELAKNEALYKYNENQLVFDDVSNVALPGKDEEKDNKLVSKCIDGKEISYPKSCSGTVDKLEKFCTLLINNLSLSEEPSITKDSCTFTTIDNISWKIEGGKDDKDEDAFICNSGVLTSEEAASASTSEETKGKCKDEDRHYGFLVTMDVNGEKEPNTPSVYSPNAYKKNGSDEWSKGVTDSNRDRFFVLVRYDGKVIIPSNDPTLQEYLFSGNMKKDSTTK